MKPLGGNGLRGLPPSDGRPPWGSEATCLPQGAPPPQEGPSSEVAASEPKAPALGATLLPTSLLQSWSPRPEGRSEELKPCPLCQPEGVPAAGTGQGRQSLGIWVARSWFCHHEVPSLSSLSVVPSDLGLELHVEGQNGVPGCSLAWPGRALSC